MKIVLALILFTVAIPFIVFPQNPKPGFDVQFHGEIIDAATKQPLGYASIGILSKPVGTVSDSLGHFELAIGIEYQNDTLQISMVGYYPVKRLVRELMKAGSPIVINLTKKVIQLNEVVVSNQFQHTEIVGRQSTGTFIQASLIPKGRKGPNIGAESGLKVQSKHYPALLTNFNFYLSANNFKYTKFRVNIYSVKNNLPDTLLYSKEIFVSLKEFKTGWTQVDLSPYRVVFDHDCAITLQWVDYNRDMAAKPEMLIPVSISFSHVNYFRNASQDKWNTVKGNASFFVTLKY